MRRHRLAAGAALLCLGCAPPPAATPTPGAGIDAPVVLALDPYLGRLKTLSATVGGDTARFLFDTGGGATFVTPEVASRLGCTPAGRSVGFRMSGERVESAYCPSAVLDLPGLSLPHAPVGVFDLMALLPEEVPPLAGVVSLRSFADRTLTVDLGCGRLVVETGASAAARVRRMTPLEARFATGPDGGELLVFLALDAGPAPAWLLLDSSNLDAVRLAPHAAALLGAPLAAGDTATLPLPLAGMPGVPVPVRVAEMILDGALNAAWMEGAVLTLDLRGGRAWGRLRAGACAETP